MFGIGIPPGVPLAVEPGTSSLQSPPSSEASSPGDVSKVYDYNYSYRFAMSLPNVCIYIHIYLYQRQLSLHELVSLNIYFGHGISQVKWVQDLNTTMWFEFAD